MKRINWLLTGGFLLSIVAFLSYLFFFYKFPITRDVPWVNYILFAIAIVLLIAGARRSQRRVISWIVATLGIVVALLFVFVMNVFTKQLPSPATAIRTGQRAPDFTLADINGKQVALSALEASAPKGVLLVFYRGYW